MAKTNEVQPTYRCLVKGGIRLADKKTIVTMGTGPFPLDAKEATFLLKNGWIAPVNAPLIPSIADETIKQQQDEITKLKALLTEAQGKMDDLGNVLQTKETDIANLLKQNTGN